MKIQHTQEVCSLSYDSLRVVKETIESWIKQYGEDATLMTDIKWGDSVYFSIEYEREETDAEKKIREQKEKDKEKRERKQLETLKKKYESK